MLEVDARPADQDGVADQLTAYKMTELGALPADWEVKRLGELFHIQQGKALGPKSRGGPSPRPFLRTANVFWGRLDLAVLDQMNFSDDEVARLALQQGDLLVCEGGDIGRTALWRGELDTCCYQNHLHRLRAARDDVEPEFFMYWMQAAIRLLNLYAGQGNQTTIPSLSKARLSRFAVPLPPLPEQRAIARVLRTVQRAREQTEAVIAVTRQLKASLLRHLFTYGPVPMDQADRVELTATEIGSVPKHWEAMNLGSVASLLSGGTPSKKRPEWWQGPIPWASPKDMKSQRLRNTQDHLSEEAVAVGSRLVPAGSIFVVVRGMILARDVPVAITDMPMAFNQDMKAILPKNCVYPNYLLFALIARKPALHHEIGTAAHGTKRIGTSALEGLLLPIPPLEEQGVIAQSLMSVERKLEAENARKRALDTLFTTLLHDLMTARVRAVALLPISDPAGAA